MSGACSEGFYLSANTEQALNNSPGPSLREKTTDVLHILVSEGDCKERLDLRRCFSSGVVWPENVALNAA